MNVQAEVSQVRSARMRCSGSAGSGNSTHSREKSRGTSSGGASDTCPAYVRPGARQTGPMRLGVLDVGSNTVHLLVVDAHRGAHPTPMHDDRWLLRLAEHVDSDGKLSKAGEKALLNAVQKAKEQAADRKCDELLAFVTSAIRDADNGAAVLRRVHEQTGVHLQVLSGEDEARLTFLAVRRWFGWSAGRLLVLDIG